jgi:hypothetical protein
MNVRWQRGRGDGTGGWRRSARRCGALWVGLAALALAAGPAPAAEVSVSVSQGQVWVGVPFGLSVRIANAAAYETPLIPAVEGIRVLGEPSASRSSYTQIINNRQITETQTVELTYQLVAEREGTFTIPPIAVLADGQEHMTRSITLVAARSEAGDLLSVEVVSPRDTWYVGEKVPLTLEVWLKPFEDPRVGTLDEGQMWSAVDLRRSSLGIFGRGETRITPRRGSRPDGQGVQQTFYVYPLRAELSPGQAGELRFDDVRILVEYPERLVRVRSILDSGWRVESSRPVVASPSGRPIHVIPPPQEGQPGFFRGAVGRFEIAASADPVDVAVGDPITLTLTILDRTPGGSDLETLQPPPLPEIPELRERFRMPSDPLAGVAQGRTKTFTQTIRAVDDEVERVPAIPFAYFDPLAGRYVIASSDPIPLEVRPGAAISVTDVVGAGPGASSPRPRELTAVAGGILPNRSGAEVLAVQAPFRPGWLHAASVAAPPLAFAVVAAGRRRVRRLRDDAGYARRRRARRRALRRLATAGRGDPAEFAGETLAALGHYVADRCNLPAGALTSEEILGRLRACGLDGDLVAEVGAVLEECERSRYAGGPAGADSVARCAGRCIERLERSPLA